MDVRVTTSHVLLGGVSSAAIMNRVSSSYENSLPGSYFSQAWECSTVSLSRQVAPGKSYKITRTEGNMSASFAEEACRSFRFVKCTAYSSVQCQFSVIPHEHSKGGSPSRFFGLSTFMNRKLHNIIRGVVRVSSKKQDVFFQLNAVENEAESQEGPTELPPLIDPFAIPEANPLQLVASVFLTGAIVVLLFRSVRRRARRAKQTKFRSTSEETVKSVEQEARQSFIKSLVRAPEIEVQAPPSAAQTFLGAVVAGLVALSLYKFTTAVEASFVGKSVSDNYSIRNLTVTVRTIISGLCYLATFVFAANSIGLTLYSLQLLVGLTTSPLPPSQNEGVPELDSSNTQELASSETTEPGSITESKADMDD